MAKIAATLAKPHGLIYVPEGSQERFLSPLPVSAIPGIGPKTHKELLQRGITTIGFLLGVPELRDRYLDLRVDDHPEPTQRLQELVAMHHVFFKPAVELEFVAIEAEVAEELQSLSKELGYYAGELNGEWDQTSKEAFEALIHNENLEERWSLDQDPDRIDNVALDYLRLRYSQKD